MLTYFLITFIMISYLSADRWDLIQTINLEGEGIYGVWQTIQYCPEGSWVRSFRHKTDKTEESLYDDVGTILVEIHCYDLNGNLLSELKTNGDLNMDRATWSNFAGCVGNQNFMRGASLKTYTSDISVTGVKMKCSDETVLIPGNEYAYGDYHSFSECPYETSICGAQSRYQDYQGRLSEDTAFNGMKIFCCRTCALESSRYVDKTTKQCLPCHYSCKTCSGGSRLDCLSCFHSEYPTSSVCATLPYMLDIEAGTHTPGSLWTASPSAITSDCGSFLPGILGGYNRFTQAAYAKKEFTLLPPHFKKRLRLRFIKIDEWISSRAIIYIDSDQVYFRDFQKTDGLLSGNVCGGNGFEYDLVFESETKNSKSNFTIKITTDLNSLTGFWGFSDFYLSILKCNSICFSCSDQNQTSCLSCYPNASLSLGVCKCVDGFYMSINNNCITPPCSECKQCPTGCKNCPGSFECSICFSDYFLDTANKTCKKCDSSCLTCKGILPTDCLSCAAPFFLSLGAGICSIKCANSNEYGSEVNRTCMKCEGTCASCSGTATNCSSCYSPRFLNEGACLNNCVSPLWGVETSRKCEKSCRGLDEYGDLSDRICKVCNPICATCSYSAQVCTSCDSPYFLTGDTCISSCPTPLWGNNSTKKCSDACLSQSEYGDIKDRICKACDAACATCKDAPENCLSCTPPRFLSSSKCLLKCEAPLWGNNLTRSCEAACANSNEYGDEVDRICKPCDSSCEACKETASNCISCFTSKFLSGNNCLAKCEAPLWGNNDSRKCDPSCAHKNEYGDTNDRICKPCDSVCESCINTAINCLSCSSSKFLNENKCVEACPAPLWADKSSGKCQQICSNHYYFGDNQDEKRICKPCSSQCAGCEGTLTNCSSCRPPLFLKGSECVEECSIDEFGDANGSRSCKKCDSQCASCQNEAGNCFSCSIGFYLTGTSCAKECLAPFWGNNSTRKCELNCSNSNEYGDIADNRICKACSPDCETCVETPKKCRSCSSPLFLLASDCISKCPSGYREDSLERRCSKCLDNEYEVYEKGVFVSCSLCEKPCMSCVGDKNLCSSCESGLFLNNRLCINSCPRGTYPDISNGICQPCFSKCVECLGAGAQSCLSCRNSSYFFKNQCLEACPSGYFADEGVWECRLCVDPECTKPCDVPKFANFQMRVCLKTCPAPLWGLISEGICSDNCQTLKFYKESGERVCKHCHASCLSCSGPSDSECESCAGELYLYGGKCLTECGDGKYGESGTRLCKNCNPSCKTCKTPDNPDFCLSCHVNSYLKASACLKECSSLEYRDFKTNLCKPCHSTCLTCFGGSSNECLSCTGSLFYYEETSDCLPNCPLPYYALESDHKCYKTCPSQGVVTFYGRNVSRFCANSCENINEHAQASDRICRTCHKDCKACKGLSSADCVDCEFPKYLKNQTCLKDCGPGYYADSSRGNYCLRCIYPCKTCVDSPGKCLSCDLGQGNLYLEDFRCVSQCSSSFSLWFDGVCRPCKENKCIACHQTCKTCNGESSNNCLSCNESYFKKDGQCVSDCGSGFFLRAYGGQKECSKCLEPGEYVDKNEGLCKKCPNQCTTCDDRGCIKCANDLFASGWSCHPVTPYTCKVCENLIPNCIQCGVACGCLRCRKGSFLLDKNNDTIFEECSNCLGNGLIKVGDKCQTCENVMEGCLECFNDPENCFSCKEGYFLNVTSSRRTCQLCSADCPCEDRIIGCSQCSYKDGKLICLMCQEGYFKRDFNGDSIIDACVRCNQQYEYISNTENQCLDCANSIKHCLNCGGDARNCSLCKEGYYKKRENDSFICSDCLGSGEVLDKIQGVCYSCSDLQEGCQKCELSEKRCLKCAPEYFLYQSTCLPNCMKTSKNKLNLLTGKCVELCEKGYFQAFSANLSQTVCSKCRDPCFECSELEDSCVSCNPGTFLLGRSCVENCPSDYVKNKQQRICSLCLPTQYEVYQENQFTCSECQRPCLSCKWDKNNCTSCESGLFLSNYSCVKSCNPGAFPNSQSGICDECDSVCKECSGKSNESCTGCHRNTFLFKKKCVKECPKGYFPDNIALECRQCHFSCKSCVGERESQCLSDCYENRNFSESSSSQNSSQNSSKFGSCLCNDGFYEAGTPECGSCHFTCKTCEGRLHTDCKLCSGNRGDAKGLPVEGSCSCPANTYDFLAPICLPAQNSSKVLIDVVQTMQQKEISSITFFSTFGMSTLNFFGLLFNIVEVAQEINLYCYLNTIMPLNLEGLLNFLSEFRFYKHFNIFSKLHIPLKNKTNEKNASLFDQEPPPMFKKKGLTASFLSNTSTIILFLIVTPFLLLIISALANVLKKRSDKKKNRKKSRSIEKEMKTAKASTISQLLKQIWKKKHLILLNILFSILLSSMQELQFFFALQMIRISFANTYNVLSFVCALAWLVYEIGIIIYIIKIYLSMNPKVVDQLNIKRKLTLYIKQKTSSNKDQAQFVPVRRDKTKYDIKKREKYSFFFGRIIKENENGMSFLFYRLLKKIILPLIHVFCNFDINTTLFYLIIFYGLSFFYLRLVEPYRYKTVAILAELTELLHINFLFLVRFYIHAIDLRSSHMALDLGLYMIYTILAIIFTNVFLVIMSLTILLGSALLSLLEKKSRAKRSLQLSGFLGLTGNMKEQDAPSGKKSKCFNNIPIINSQEPTRALDDKEQSKTFVKNVFIEDFREQNNHLFLLGQSDDSADRLEEKPGFAKDNPEETIENNIMLSLQKINQVPQDPVSLPSSNRFGKNQKMESLESAEGHKVQDWPGKKYVAKTEKLKMDMEFESYFDNVIDEVKKIEDLMKKKPDKKEENYNKTL